MPTPPCDDPEGRRLGRPRSAEADGAILAAATELFCAHGLDGMSVEAIANRAGVSKATIYRRYPSKVEIVVAAAWCLSGPAWPVPDTGETREDLSIHLRNLARMLQTTELGRAMPMLLAEKQRNPELAEAHHRFVAERRTATRGILERGIERGDVDPRADLELMMDMLSAPLFYRQYHSGASLGPAVTDAIVDAVLRSFAPAPTAKRPPH